MCSWLACLILFSSGGGGGRSRTGRPPALYWRVAERILYQSWRLGAGRLCPSCPDFPISPPHLPTELAWLSARLQAGPALSPDACYLHTHLWTNGRPGWLLVTPAWRGPSSQACVWQFGLEPKVGGLTIEEAQPSPTPGAFNSRMRLLEHSIHGTGIRARKLIPSHCPFAHLVL